MIGPIRKLVDCLFIWFKEKAVLKFFSNFIIIIIMVRNEESVWVLGFIEAISFSVWAFGGKELIWHYQLFDRNSATYPIFWQFVTEADKFWFHGIGWNFKPCIAHLLISVFVTNLCKYNHISVVSMLTLSQTLLSVP